MDGVFLVEGGRSGAGEVVDLVGVEEGREGVNDIVFEEGEIGIFLEEDEIGVGGGLEVIDGGDMVALREEF